MPDAVTLQAFVESPETWYICFRHPVSMYVRYGTVLGSAAKREVSYQARQLRYGETLREGEGYSGVRDLGKTQTVRHVQVKVVVRK